MKRNENKIWKYDFKNWLKSVLFKLFDTKFTAYFLLAFRLNYIYT